jgi:hypothetical protein
VPFDPVQTEQLSVFINKSLLFLRYSFRAMGYIQTKINLQFLDKEENGAFSLERQTI